MNIPLQRIPRWKYELRRPYLMYLQYKVLRKYNKSASFKYLIKTAFELTKYIKM